MDTHGVTQWCREWTRMVLRNGAPPPGRRTSQGSVSQILADVEFVHMRLETSAALLDGQLDGLHRLLACPRFVLDVLPELRVPLQPCIDLLLHRLTTIFSQFAVAIAARTSLLLHRLDHLRETLSQGSKIRMDDFQALVAHAAHHRVQILQASRPLLLHLLKPLLEARVLVIRLIQGFPQSRDIPREGNVRFLAGLDDSLKFAQARHDSAVRSCSFFLLLPQASCNFLNLASQSLADFLQGRVLLRKRSLSDLPSLLQEALRDVVQSIRPIVLLRLQPCHATLDALGDLAQRPGVLLALASHAVLKSSHEPVDSAFTLPSCAFLLFEMHGQVGHDAHHLLLRVNQTPTRLAKGVPQ